MILKNCRLLPQLCEGFQEEAADIRIEGKAIAEILPANGQYIDDNVIDCAGKTVLPGLFNIHVHLFMDDRRGRFSEAVHTLRCLDYAYTLLSYGYTSIRDMGSPYAIANRLRDAINANELIGPDIKSCGYVLCPDRITAPLDSYSSRFGLGVNNPSQARAIARQQLAEGADFIKVLGCASNAHSRMKGKPLFFDDEMVEFRNVANRENTYLAIHCTSEESCEQAIAFGARSIEHGNMLSRDNIDQLIARGRKTAIVPTVACMMRGGGEMVKTWGTSPAMELAYEAKLWLGWGTDVSCQEFLKDPALEWTSRQNMLGFKTIDMLKQATINSAIINQTDHLRGSIKVGKRADFAIFDGKPDEDLALFGKPCAYVLKDGEIVARDGFILSRHLKSY